MKTFLKSIGLLILLFPSLLFGQEENSFLLKGKVPKELKQIYLIYYDYGTDEQIIDSAKVLDGNFSFSGNIDGACYSGLYFRDNLRDENSSKKTEFWFFMNPGENVIDATLDKPEIINGGKETQEYIAYNKEVEKVRSSFKSPEYSSYEEKIDDLEKQVQQLKKERDQKFGTWEEQISKSKLQFIKEHPNNSLSIVFLENMLDVENVNPEFKSVFNGLSEELRKSSKGKKIAHIFNAANFVEGVEAPDFEQADANGKMVKLSDFRGKYVLIDFWASWCVPCRKENPNVVNAYEKFKSKNFEIIGVSLDNNKENWLKAIQDDGLGWVNLSDLKGWKNEVAQQYAINAVPSNLLISPEGKILAKNLRGEDLQKFLDENLK